MLTSDELVLHSVHLNLDGSFNLMCNLPWLPTHSMIIPSPAERVPVETPTLPPDERHKPLPDCLQHVRVLVTVVLLVLPPAYSAYIPRREEHGHLIYAAIQAK